MRFGAQANRSEDGSLPGGKGIARQYGRDELPDDWSGNPDWPGRWASGPSTEYPTS
jgi:hypothetical protein